MDNRYRLELIGITYNQIESGVYALILQQVGTNRRIPIIIGFPEAQAIECKLQEIRTPRPLTHDIMITALKEFGVTIDYVLIKRLDNGVFAADLYLNDGERRTTIDARSSDAVALAIRCGAPIYTTEDVIREAGFNADEIRSGKTSAKEPERKQTKAETQEESMETMSLQQLSEAMMKAAESEDYEEAAKIKAIIDKRKKDSPEESLPF